MDKSIFRQKKQKKVFDSFASYGYLLLLVIAFTLVLSVIAVNNVGAVPILESSSILTNGLTPDGMTLSNELTSTDLISTDFVAGNLSYPSLSSNEDIGVYVEKKYYQKNELININVRYPENLSQKVYLEIYNKQNPEYFYRYIDISEKNIAFLAQQPGAYLVNLYMVADYANVDTADVAYEGYVASSEYPGYVDRTLSQRMVEDVLLMQNTFVVYDYQEYRDCKNYSSNDVVSIDLRYYADKLNYSLDKKFGSIYLLHHDIFGAFNRQLKYSDTFSEIIYFSKPENGIYYLLLDDIYTDCYIVNDVSVSNDLSVSSHSIGGVVASDNVSDTNSLSNSYPDTNFYLSGTYLLNILGLSGLYDSYTSSGFSGNLSDFSDLNARIKEVQKYYENKRHEDIRAIIGNDTVLSYSESRLLSDKISSNSINGRASIKIVDSSGNFQNTFMVLKDEKTGRYIEGNLLDINNDSTGVTNITSMIKEYYQADLYFANSIVKKVRFNKLDKSFGLDLSFEDLPVEDIVMTNVSRGDFINAFAIDPRRVHFTDATVTFTAVGNALWKCKDYVFDTKTCKGDFVKVMDMIPGQEYSFILTPEDPIFTQSIYLDNPSFASNTSGWTTLTDVSCNGCGYAWVASDGSQSGVAEIYNTGRSRTGTLNYYQIFNLSIPQGTNLTNVTFSALWRISNYDQPGNVYFWIQNSARTLTYCSWNQSFTTTTAWATTTLKTNGSNGCNLSNFTKNMNYTIRLRCNIVTSAARNERCHWDDVNITAFYIDVQTPTLVVFNNTPDPVNYSLTLNFTANVTDNIQVDTVWIQINGTNYIMNYSSASGLYYFDTFNTSIYPQKYPYNIYANDTSNNTIFSNAKNFTINDNLLPIVSVMNPSSGSFSNVSNTYFYYNVSDESGIANCSLRIDGTIRTTNTTVQKNIQQNLNATLTQGLHYWNITCYDNSTNNNSMTILSRNITVDTIAPVVGLNYPGNNIFVSGYSSKIIFFNYTPTDINLNNCSLYLNATGLFALNQTNTTPINTTVNTFFVFLNDGVYLWNVGCCDKALNCAFNATNYTVRVDSTPPYWSNNMTNPDSGVTWSTPKMYQFNITWNDAMTNVSRVWIEHNFSGPMQNYSVQNITNKYYYILMNLSAGTYAYRWYANDTLNNINSTPYYTYVVNTAPSTISLLLNGTDSDINISQGGTVNITAKIIVPTSGHIELYQDGVLINSGNDALINISTYNLQLQYNITAIYPTTQNYSAASVTHFITVTDTVSPTVHLGNPEDNSWNMKTVTLYYTPNDNIDITNCTLILDGMINETKNSQIGVSNNFTINLTDGTHNWTVGCRDSKNNYGQNDTVKYVRVDTQTPSPFSLSTPLNKTISNNATPILIWSQTIEMNFLNYTLLIDNNPNFLIPDRIYYTFNVTNVTYVVPVIDSLGDNIWYWKVIANDIPGNNYHTSHYIYIVDTAPPTINILSPENNRYSNSLTQNFGFTLTDFTEITNCSLLIDGSIDQTNFTVNKSLIQNFTKTFAAPGTYTWSVECYDQAKNRQLTTGRNLYIDQTPPMMLTLFNPENLTLSKNNTPLLNWSQTIESNFENYTIQISDNPSFIYINYTYANLEITNTTHLTAVLPDTIFYWRVIAYDKAGNNYTTRYNSYEIDTIPPTEFNLLKPDNMSSSNNVAPLLTWTQTSDLHFTNYTVQVSDDDTYPYLNFTYFTLNITNTTYQASGWLMNRVYYWRVIAFDNASNNYTTESFMYTTDDSSPNVTLISPANNTNWNSSTTVAFIFNVSDISSINNCSLIVNNQIVRTVLDIEKNINQTIYEGFTNGLYNWSINCTDAAGYEAKSLTRFLLVNVTLPNYIFYETDSLGTASLPIPSQSNLSTNYDFVENYVQTTINGVDYNLANASIVFNGSGFMLYSNTRISFSGVFQANTRNAGRANWGIYIQNSSGTTLICQTPGGASGSLITTRNAKETEIGNCTSPNYDIRFKPDDKLILRVNIYSGSSVTYMHYMDNANPSYVSMDGYKLGVLNVTLVNITDQQPGEGFAFLEECNVTCRDGYCLDADVHYMLNNSATQNYTMIGATGNVILNGTQYNPAVLATINSSSIVNVSLFANNYSVNNSFRCYAESLYSNATSNSKNITVTDKTFPTVTLVSPQDPYSSDPGTITFSYTPFDNRLKNCSIYTNITGLWIANQTDNSPLKNELNYFNISIPNYGRYLWNVQCCDIAGNCEFNELNHTLNIAGDLAIYVDGVSFSDNNPAEGENITIYANIYNLANRTEQNLLIRFYENDPDIDGVPIGADRYIAMNGLTNMTVNTSWIASKGIHYIYVKVDPLDTVIESNENNNKGHNMTFTAIWQVYYGDVTMKITNLGVNSTSLFNWSTLSDMAGNVYIADSDSTVSWTTLQALTRDIYNNTNVNTADDFEDLDSCLSTTVYGDNINTTYSMNGEPAMTSTYDIYNVLVNNVPEATSTNNTNFYTGILWDISDSADDYYSCQGTPSLREDIVFVTKMNLEKIGKYGLYDYEIKVPGELGDYKGATNSVALYYEIQ